MNASWCVCVCVCGDNREPENNRSYTGSNLVRDTVYPSFPVVLRILSTQTPGNYLKQATAASFLPNLFHRLMHNDGLHDFYSSPNTRGERMNVDQMRVVCGLNAGEEPERPDSFEDVGVDGSSRGTLKNNTIRCAADSFGQAVVLVRTVRNQNSLRSY